MRPEISDAFRMISPIPTNGRRKWEKRCSCKSLTNCLHLSHVAASCIAADTARRNQAHNIHMIALLNGLQGTMIVTVHWGRVPGGFRSTFW